MTTPKIDSTVTADVGDVLGLHADRLYRNLGSTVIAVVELKAVERVQPAPDEDKTPAVRLRVIGLEIATGAHDDQVRRVMQALYQARTSSGTLDELDHQAAQQTIEHAADVIAAADLLPDRTLPGEG